MIFSFEENIYVWIALGCGALFCVIMLSIQFLRWWRLRRQVKRETELCESEEEMSRTDLPSVSVVIYAHNGADYLRESLPFFLRQDYPNFEVIVVNEASEDDTDIVVSDLKPRFPNLRLTFVPKDMQNVSRRKLALMLGIKAAEKEMIVTTNSNCHPTSLRWLRLLMSGVESDTEVVIGYSHPHYRKDEGGGRLWRAYDIVCDSVPYLSAAIGGSPYRGISDNLAYKRGTFFYNKGFAKSVNLHQGDDDVFVHEIARRHNTKVALLRESQMVADYYNYPFEYSERKQHYGFTARFLPQWQYWLTGMASLSYYMVLISAGVACALSPLNWLVVGLAGFIVLLTWVLMSVLHVGNARRLGAPGCGWLVPWFALARPRVNLRYKIKIHNTISYNYTWRSNNK